MRSMVLMLFALSACTKSRKVEADLLAFRDLKDLMCRCKDTACAEKVQQDMNRWSETNARNAPTKPTEAVMQEMQTVGTQYGECMAKAMNANAVAEHSIPPPSDAVPTPPIPEQSLLPKVRDLTERMCACKDSACVTRVTDELVAWGKSMPSNPPTPKPAELAEMQTLSTRLQGCINARGESSEIAGFPAAPTSQLKTADEIIHHTYAGLTGFGVARLELSYVHADGTLDPAYGKAAIRLGRSRTALEDDPSRPLGAPLPDPEPADEVAKRKCPDVAWNRGARTHTLKPCQLVDALPRPRCAVAEVWKQAIAKGAPAEGLAVLGFRRGANPAEPPYWSFVIDDAPRKFHFLKHIPDTCEVVAEKPL